jgi:hypothetical protein
MEFIDIPTEQTTAATDADPAITAIVSAIYLYSLSKNNKWKAILRGLYFFGLSKPY